jgi:mono/diheme cytochrome c family protein
LRLGKGDEAAIASSGEQAAGNRRRNLSPKARRGEQLYKTSCSYCHRDDLSGGFFDDGTGRAPALAGERVFNSSFVERWNDASLGEVLATIASTMPQNRPASLNLQTYVDILTYLLSRNGIPSGPRELPTDLERLQQIVVTPKP